MTERGAKPMTLEAKKARRAALEAEIAGYDGSAWERKVADASAAKEAAEVQAMVEGTPEARAAADRAATGLRNAIEASEDAAERNRLQRAALDILRDEVRAEARQEADARADEEKARIEARLKEHRDLFHALILDAFTAGSLGRTDFLDPENALRVLASVAGIDVGVMIREARRRAAETRRGTLDTKEAA